MMAETQQETTDGSDPANKAETETATEVEAKVMKEKPPTTHKPANDQGSQSLTHHVYNPDDHMSNAGTGTGTAPRTAAAAAVAATDTAASDGEIVMAATNTNSPKPPSAALGHEGFVHPSSYLRPRPQSRPMTPAAAVPLPLTAVDRDQKYGLVSTTS